LSIFLIIITSPIVNYSTYLTFKVRYYKESKGQEKAETKIMSFARASKLFAQSGLQLVKLDSSRSHGENKYIVRDGQGRVRGAFVSLGEAVVYLNSRG
jgi:hypothetical protein